VPCTLDVSFEANKALSAAAAADEETEAARVPRSFYQAAFNALNEAFTSMGTGEGTRIVVFIDDLDRCLPTGALEVLESMKLFFDLPGFIFVVGLDRSVVEWCIDSRYQRERPAGAAVSADAYSVKGADYINKIFQVPFTLPPVAVSDMDEFMDAVIEDNGLVDPQADHLRRKVGPHLAYVVGDLGVNPRRLKQYINSYILQVSVKPKLDVDAVLAIQTITYRDDWKVVRGALYTDRHMLLSALGNTDVGARREALEDLDPEYADIPDSFLAYVAEGPAGAAGSADNGPGRPLLAVGELIDEYLYAGEATLSTVSTPLLTIIPRVGKLRRLLRLAIGDDGLLNQQHLEAFRKELGVVQSNVTSVPGAMAQLVARSLEDMLASAGPIDPVMGAEALKAWRAENEQQIALAKKNLLRAYDASRTPAGNVDQSASSSVAS
jgi:KAP family P-loop domain